MSNKKYTILDENPFNDLSDYYNSVSDGYYRTNDLSVKKVNSALNPPSEFQNRLVANNFPYNGSEIFEKQYPELLNRDHPRKVSPESIYQQAISNKNFYDVQKNINAGIPPQQVNPDISTSENQVVKMPTDFSNQTNRVRTRQGCMDYINHYHRCPSCIRYMSYDKNMYLMVILMIIIVASIIIFFLYKDIQRLKRKEA
jgi:hypothetical protein